MSSPLRFFLRFALNCSLVWAMATYVEQYFFVTGGIGAYVVIGALLTLLNLIVRPILRLITLPLRLLATLLAIILVNGVFLWTAARIILLMDPNLVTMEILGGIGGWIVVSSILGIGNYLMKLVLK